MGEAETYLGEKKWEDYRGGWSCSSVAAREGGGEMKRGRKNGREKRRNRKRKEAEKERRRGADSESDGPAGGLAGCRARKGSKRFQRNPCHSYFVINAWLRADYLLR